MKGNIDFLREIIEDFNNSEAEEFLDSIADEFRILKEENDTLIDKNIKLQDENICLLRANEELESEDIDYEEIDCGTGTIRISSDDSMDLQLAIGFLKNNPDYFLKLAKM